MIQALKNIVIDFENQQLDVEVRRYRAIMISGTTLVPIWGYIFSNYFHLNIPLYFQLSLFIFVGFLSTFVNQLKKYQQSIYAFVAYIALIHHAYLVILNQTHVYTVMSSILAFLMAIIPIRNSLLNIIFYLSSIFFSIYLVFEFKTELSIVYLLTLLSCNLVILIMTNERNKLIEQVKIDYTTIQEERLKSTSAAKMAALGEMSSGIAHEINNPLTIISGNLAIIQKKIEQNDELKEVLKPKVENAQKMVLRISKIIKGLKSFARESQGEESEFEFVLFGDLIDETLSFCKTRFINHNVEFILINQTQNLKIYCQPTQLTQVLLNLLNNSFDALESEKTKIIKLSTAIKNKNIEIIVEDSGPGFSDLDKEKAFTPFYTTKEVGKGTGLGLSISRGIVDKHKGHILIDKSTELGGAKISIILPFEQS